MSAGPLALEQTLSLMGLRYFPSHAATSAGERVRLSSFSTFMQMAAVTTSELSESTDAKRNFAHRCVSASISWSRRLPSSASSTIHETCGSHGESVATMKRTCRRAHALPVAV